MATSMYRQRLAEMGLAKSSGNSATDEAGAADERSASQVTAPEAHESAPREREDAAPEADTTQAGKPGQDEDHHEVPEEVHDAVTLSPTEISETNFQAGTLKHKYADAGNDPYPPAEDAPPQRPAKFTFNHVSPAAGAGKDEGFVQVRSMPLPLVEALYRKLSEAAGREVTRRDVPLQSVVTAALMTVLGDHSEVDETTGWALNALRSSDLRLRAVESVLSEGRDDIRIMASMVEKLAKHMGQVAETTARMDWTTAYVLADRVGLLSHENEKFDDYRLIRPEVRATRDQAVSQVAEHLQYERRSEGRRRA